MKSTLIVILLLWFISLNSYAQTNEPIQDQQLNNLVLPEGYATSELGLLGRVDKIGSGKQAMILIPGWGFGGDVFKNFAKQYEHSHTIYVTTLAGFAGTPAPPIPENGAYDKQLWTNGAVSGILDLIAREKLNQPLIIAHFNVATQVALSLALNHADKIGKVVLLSGIPYRYYRPFADTVWGKEQIFNAEERTNIVNQYWAPAWYKTVTKKTWDSGNHTPEEYSMNYDIGKSLFDQSAEVPMSVMIQYLLEFFTYDASPRYPDIKVPVLVLLPSFSEEFFSSTYLSINQVISREWTRYYYLESWNSARRAGNANITFKTIPESHVFLWYDNPQDTYDAINKFINSKKS